MNQVDAIAAVQAVRSLRRANYLSVIARKMEVYLCAELILAAGSIWTDTDADAILTGYKLDTLSVVCAGIIRGRPGDGDYPWRLQ